MEDKLRDFLRERGVDNECLEKMDQDKVDVYVIHAADDAVLDKYLNRPGDLLAAKQFCKDFLTKRSEGQKHSKNKLLAKLRSKLLLSKAPDKNSDSESEDMPHSSNKKQRLNGNLNAKKDTRKIEIGWLHDSGSGYKQVRARRGGGTRKIDINKNANQFDVLKEAKLLFFPNNTSPFGNIYDFNFQIGDYSESMLGDSLETVGEMYRRTAMGAVLRFYMVTNVKSENPSPRKVTGVNEPIGHCASDDELDDLLPAFPLTQSLLDNSETEVFFKSLENVTQSASKEVEQFDSPMDQQAQADSSSLLAAAASFVQLSDQPSAHFPAAINASMDVHDIDGAELESTPVNIELTVHRGALSFNELINYFKHANITNAILSITRVLPNGEKEPAEDTGGVLRDMLSDFWADFYSKCTLGRISKVPCLRHDFGYEEWTSVGRILLYGWENVGYWPTSLSKSFFFSCLGEQIISSDLLMSDFYNFIPKSEKETMERVLNCFESVEEDELFEVLEAHDCKVRLNQENVKATFLEMAHKELIQVPMFVTDCWRDMLKRTTLTKSKLCEIYEGLIPTNKRVTKMLKFPDGPLNDTGKHLQRYVKEIDEKKLGLFLRFCTGADVMTVSQIDVVFVDITGLARRPVSHTCGCVLELPKQYENYMEFRREFDGVLESNVWVMDIV